jgi:flavin-dependent dehydrogenase
MNHTSHRAAEPYDVVIVGARVAGASTALLLARAGARVALLDRAGYGTDTVSTHGLMRAGVMQLSRWGLLEPVVAAGTPAIRRTLFHYGCEETIQVSIKPSAGVEALYAPRRSLLDRILVDAAAEAGADVYHEIAVTGVTRHPAGRVTGVHALDRSGRTFDLAARVTVGADGIRSTVAAEVGSRVVRQGASASGVLYRYFADLPAAGYEWAYGDGAAAGLLPTNDALVCAFVGTTPRRMRDLRRLGPDEAFAALAQEVNPRLAARLREARPVGRWHGWAGVPGFVRTSHGSGWALVGDAGYFKDPITTHGMTDGLRDAELLATALLDSLAGGVLEQVALARYQHVRDSLSRSFFDATEAVASYRWNRRSVQPLLRQVSSAMSDEVDHLSALPDRPPEPASTPAPIRNSG